MFTDMKQGTREEWMHIAQEHGRHQVSAAPKQIISVHVPARATRPITPLCSTDNRK